MTEPFSERVTAAILQSLRICGQRLVEGRGLVERLDLVAVGKDDVDGARAHQVEELVAVAVDAERIRQRHRHFAPGGMRQLRRLPDRFLGARRVPQIALEIGDRGARSLVGLDVFRAELDAGAEIGVHRALAVRRDEDHRARRRRLALERPGVEGDALGMDVVGVDFAERIVRHLAEEGGATAEAGDTRRRVAGAAAGGLDRRAHAAVEQLGAPGVDQVHGALDDAVRLEKRFVALGDDVDNRIADAKHVIFRHHCLRQNPRRLSGMPAGRGSSDLARVCLAQMRGRCRARIRIQAL